MYRNNSGNACLVIHFLTNQMQINFNSKIMNFDLASSSVIWALTNHIPVFCLVFEPASSAHTAK